MSQLHGLIATLFLLLPSGAALADDAADVLTAVDDFYSKVAKGDLEGLAAYLPSRGFTEFNTDGTELKTLDKALFKGAFENRVSIDFQVEEKSVRVIHGGSAIVTGYRVGAISFPDGRRVASRNCSSMVWFKPADQWMLEHIHLSACPAAP